MFLVFRVLVTLGDGEPSTACRLGKQCTTVPLSHNVPQPLTENSRQGLYNRATPPSLLHSSVNQNPSSGNRRLCRFLCGSKPTREGKVLTHLDLIDQVFIDSVRIALQELDHNLADVNFLLHQPKYWCILWAGLHQKVFSKCWEENI